MNAEDLRALVMQTIEELGPEKAQFLPVVHIRVSERQLMSLYGPESDTTYDATAPVPDSPVFFMVGMEGLKTWGRDRNKWPGRRFSRYQAFDSYEEAMDAFLALAQHA